MFVGVPSPPANLRVTNVFKDSCILSWSASGTDGGSPILGYHVERRTGGHSGRWTKITGRYIADTSYHVVDLIEGSAYEFRITAENKVGESQPCSPSLPVTAKDPWDTPGVPGTPTVSDITKRSCKLSWSPPTSDGGNAIRNYLIEYRAVGAFKWLLANEGDRTTDTTYKVIGLHTDTEYDFRIAAENKAGAGPYASTAMAIMAKDPIRE